MKRRQFKKIVCKGNKDIVQILYRDEETSIIIDGYLIGTAVLITDPDETIEVNGKDYGYGDILIYAEESLGDSIGLAQSLMEYILNLKDPEGGGISLIENCTYTMPNGTFKECFKGLNV